MWRGSAGDDAWIRFDTPLVVHGWQAADLDGDGRNELLLGTNEGFEGSDGAWERFDLCP
jgi:hypothetical protein